MLDAIVEHENLPCTLILSLPCSFSWKLTWQLRFDYADMNKLTLKTNAEDSKTSSKLNVWETFSIIALSDLHNCTGILLRAIEILVTICY